MKLRSKATSILLVTASVLATSAVYASEVERHNSASQTLRNLLKTPEQSGVMGDSSDPSKFDQELPTIPEASAVEIELLGGGSPTNTQATQRMRNLRAVVVQGEDEMMAEMVRKTPNIQAAVQGEQSAFSPAPEVPEPATTAALLLIATSLGFTRRQSNKC